MKGLKRIYLALVAILLSPITVNADIVEISGSANSDGLWDITYIEGDFVDYQTLLETQEWWGDPTLALLFADALGYVDWVNNFGVGIGPMFFYWVEVNLSFSAWNDSSVFGPEGALHFIGSGGSHVFATASRVPVPAESDAVRNLVTPVPEPSTLALLGFGLVGMAARRRKKV